MAVEKDAVRVCGACGVGPLRRAVKNVTWYAGAAYLTQAFFCEHCAQCGASFFYDEDLRAYERAYEAFRAQARR